MDSKKGILLNTVSLLTGSIVTNITGFIAIVYLARVLHPYNFGKLNFAIAFVSYFVLIVNMGLPLFGTREVSRAKDKIKGYLVNICSLRLCLAFLGFPILIGVTFFIDKPAETKYLILLYGLEMIPSALIIDWIFQAVERMGYISFGRIISSISYLMLVLCFIATPSQLLLIPCFKVFGTLLMAGFLILIFFRQFGPLKFKFASMEWKNIIQGSLPIGFSLLMAQIFYNIDTVMLGFMRSNEEIGYYNSAYMFIMFLIISVGAYHNAVYPLISNYFMTSLPSLKLLMENTTRLMAILSIPLAIGGTLLAGPLMNLFFGSDYYEGKIVFQILIWAVLIIYLNTGYSRGVLACNRQQWYFWGTAIPAAINIICNFILIPPMGIKGAAIATVVAEAGGFIVMYNAFKPIVHVRFWKYILKPLVAAIMMSLFLFCGLEIFHLNIFLLLMGGILVYFLSLFIINGISESDLKILYQKIFQRDE